MTIRVAIIGASGRMGHELFNVIPEYKDIALGFAVVSGNSPSLGKQCSKYSDVQFSSDLDFAIAESDAVIDFSTPKISLDIVKICAKYKKPLLIGTTGHTESDRQEIKKFADKVSILIAPNTSLGVYAFHQISLLAQKILGESFQIEIFEAHHSHKKDAPSGTAKNIALALAEQGDLTIVSNRGNVSRKDKEIGIQSLRGGDIVGEHTIFFLGSGERLELTHRASNRAIFARGALSLISRLVGMQSGLYTVGDVLNA